MKYYIKTLFVFTLSIVMVNALQAQTENTSERLIDQLKNGTAPGLRFSSEKPVAHPQKDQVSEIQKRESLIALIRKGTAPNMKFQAGTAARTVEPGAALTRPTAAVKHGPLASELEI